MILSFFPVLPIFCVIVDHCEVYLNNLVLQRGPIGRDVLDSFDCPELRCDVVENLTGGWRTGLQIEMWM